MAKNKYFVARMDIKLTKKPESVSHSIFFCSNMTDVKKKT